MNTIFTENWEQRLEMQFLKNDRCRYKHAFCSGIFLSFYTGVSVYQRSLTENVGFNIWHSVLETIQG